MSQSSGAYKIFLVTYLLPQRGRVIGLAIALFSSIGLQVLNPQMRQLDRHYRQRWRWQNDTAARTARATANAIRQFVLE